MSDTETHKGKLIPIIVSGDTMEERAENACHQVGIIKSESYDTWLAFLQDEGYRSIYIDGDIIYKIENTQLTDNFSTATFNDDGTVDYFISYYNGGASFDEAIEYTLSKARNQL